MTRIITNGFPTRGLWRIHHNLRVPSCPFVVHGSRNTRGMTNDQCLRLCPTAFSPSPTAFSASPTDFRSRSPAFSASPTASFIPAQGKAALAAAALGLVRKRSTQPEGLPHPPPQTPRSIVNQRGFSIRCSLLGGPHQPMFPHPPRRPSARTTLPGPENHRKSGQVALKRILAGFAGGGSLPLIDAEHRFSRRAKPRRQPLNSSTKFQARNAKRRKRPECGVSVSEPGKTGKALTGMAAGKPDKNPQVPTFRPSDLRLLPQPTDNRQPTTLPPASSTNN